MLHPRRRPSFPLASPDITSHCESLPDSLKKVQSVNNMVYGCRHQLLPKSSGWEEDLVSFGGHWHVPVGPINATFGGKLDETFIYNLQLILLRFWAHGSSKQEQTKFYDLRRGITEDVQRWAKLQRTLSKIRTDHVWWPAAGICKRYWSSQHSYSMGASQKGKRQRRAAERAATAHLPKDPSFG